MNSHINRWKKNHNAVQKVIDELPPITDDTEELDLTNNRSVTVS